MKDIEKLKKAISIIYSAYITLDFLLNQGKRSKIQTICDNVLVELYKKMPDMLIIENLIRQMESEALLIKHNLNETTLH